MPEVICHIVGMNNLIKPSFISKMEEYNIGVVDLDVITNNIRQDKGMIKLNRALDRSKNNSEEKRSNIRKINRCWKDVLESNLQKIYQDSSYKKLIFLGLSTFHRNHRVRVKINTSNRFFVKADPEQHAKEIVEYNLEKYRPFIIDGSFPIKYLDYKFLIDQNDRLAKIYSNMGYKLKPLHSIEQWLNLHKNSRNVVEVEIDNKNIKIQEAGFSLPKQKIGSIYIASPLEFDDYFKCKRGKKKRRVNKYLGKLEESFASPEKWLAIMYSVPDAKRHFKKGFYSKASNQTPFIEERYEGAFDVLKKPIFLYEVVPDQIEEIRWFKLKATDDLKIINKERVEDVYDELYRQNVKLIEFRV